MKGIILFDRELDNPYSSSGDSKIKFTVRTGEMKVKFHSSKVLEQALAYCEEYNIPLHIIVTRWMGSKEYFSDYAAEEHVWWYERLLNTEAKTVLHLSKTLYNYREGFLDRVSRESLGIPLPSRTYLGRERALNLSDIQTMLLHHGWLTGGNKNLWEVFLQDEKF